MIRRGPPRERVGRVLLAIVLVAGCGEVPAADGGAATARSGAAGADAGEPGGSSAAAATRATSLGIQIVDASGARVSLAAPASRIVSLVPSATQTLHALGALDALVGRTDFDTQAWVRDVPSVGGGLEPNLEALVALEPDLVIRFEGTQDPRTPSRLDDLGIRHMAVRPDHVDDIYRTAELLGAVTGRAATADSLVESIRRGLQSVASDVADRPRLRFVYVLGGTPPWVSGPDTYIDEIVSLAGGDNAFSDLGALYSSVSPEQLRTREVDVVLVSGEGTFDASLTPGARVVVIGDILEIPGPDVVAAARRVAELLHPPSAS